MSKNSNRKGADFERAFRNALNERYPNKSFARTHSLYQKQPMGDIVQVGLPFGMMIELKSYSTIADGIRTAIKQCEAAQQERWAVVSKRPGKNVMKSLVTMSLEQFLDLMDYVEQLETAPTRSS